MQIGRPAPLLAVCALMFGFGFLLVPLYSVFCEWAGINGKTAGIYENVDALPVIEDRIVKVQFVGNHNANLSWPFKPNQAQVKVQVGVQKKITFTVVNPTNSDVVAQAVPSVAPSEAAPHLHKIECFCFNQQPLTAGQVKEMPLVFFIDSDLPKHIKKITLSYTLFDVTPRLSKRVAVSSSIKRQEQFALAHISSK
ncbi:MAG: cytochrome c oxidase assembly protein [Pseudomonadales bacterium]|nr:cytochrome c oxidase assembly protein [Pseudomonadales bacterium]